MRIPKTVKEFEESFNIADMQPPEWIAAIEEALIRQRGAAADEGRKLLFDRGYFNGEITNLVTDENGSTKVKASLLCWGLPHVNPPGVCDDCGGLGSPPGEMAGMVCGGCQGTGIESDEEID